MKEKTREGGGGVFYRTPGTQERIMYFKKNAGLLERGWEGESRDQRTLAKEGNEAGR